MPVKNLHSRYFQPQVFNWLVQNVVVRKRTALLLPTGSGKTTLILCYLAWNFEQVKQGAPGFLEAYIMAPLKSIQDSFKEGCDSTYRLLDVDTADNDLGLIQSEDLEGKALDAIIQRTPSEPKWYTGTHSLLSLRVKDLERWEQLGPFDFSKKLLVVDEGHHARPDNKLTAFIAFWLRHGGHVLYATATPKDALDAPEGDEGILPFQIPLVELMERDCAPESIISRFVDTGLAADTEAETGPDRAFNVPKLTDNASANERAFDEMASLWLMDGRPKLIVRIKPTSNAANTNRLLVLAKRAFLKACPAARVMTVRSYVGDGSFTNEFDLPERLSEVLREERDRTYSTSQLDVIITLNTMIEGADWPLCSQVYLWGVPDSYPTIIQILGRSLRLKTWIADYPAPWRNTSKITFFVGGVSQDGVLPANARHMLIVGTSLANYELGSQWSTFREDMKLVRAHPKLESDVRKGTLEVPPTRQAEIKQDVVAFISGFQQTYSGDLSSAIKNAKEYIRAQFRRLFAKQVLDKLPPIERAYAKMSCLEQSPEIREHYAQAVRHRISDGRSFDEAKSEALDELLDRFLDLTTGPPALLQDLEAQGSLRMTAPVLKEITEELFERCPPNLLRSRIVNNTLAYIKDHPGVSFDELLGQADPLSFNGETFRAYDRAARSGTRGLEAHPDGLASLVCAKYDARETWPVALQKIQDLVLGHRQNKTPKKTLLDGFRHPLGFFYGEALFEIVDKFGLDVCESLRLWEAVQIGRARWTAKQRQTFLDARDKVSVQEAIDAIRN